MKRIILKILATIVEIIILVVILLNVYNSFNIDSRIWFFIIFGTVMILLWIVPVIVFYNELEQLQNFIKTHNFKKFYEEYLEKPGSYRAEKLLHTNYKKREKYNIE